MIGIFYIWQKMILYICFIMMCIYIYTYMYMYIYSIYIILRSRIELKMVSTSRQLQQHQPFAMHLACAAGFLFDATCIISFVPPGTTSKTSGGVTQHFHPAVEARGFRVNCEEHQGCSNHHVKLENGHDHQTPLDLRWPLDRSYVFWSSVLIVGCPTGTIKT